MTAPYIELKNLHKSFGKKHVLNGLNIEVGKGRSLVVIGGSGTGKSVMLKCILGILTPDEGEITIAGENVLGLKTKARDEYLARFGMLFQGSALFDSLAVWENVAFGLIQGRGMARQQAREIAIKKLAQVGLNADVALLYPAELSGGMQKRVALARAIAVDPEIIFFDEPTAGLDPIMSGVISELILKCSKELGATTITITHDMHCAKVIADKIAMIHEGKFIWQGKGKDMLKSGNKYLDQFIHGRAEGPISTVVS